MTKKGFLVGPPETESLINRFTGKKRLIMILVLWDFGLIDSSLKGNKGSAGFKTQKYPPDIKKLLKKKLLKENIDGSPDMSPLGRKAAIAFIEENQDIGKILFHLAEKYDIDLENTINPR